MSQEFTGFINSLSSEMIEVLDELRAYVNNSKYDDKFLLRFCRARKFVIEKIKVMWDNC